jgi:hypothetical protein
MIRGRHRGLPVAIDRAIVLPNEFSKKTDNPEPDLYAQTNSALNTGIRSQASGGPTNDNGTERPEVPTNAGHEMKKYPRTGTRPLDVVPESLQATPAMKPVTGESRPVSPSALSFPSTTGSREQVNSQARNDP